MRLETRFAEHVAASPDVPSVTDDRGRSLTRSELWERARLLADDLAQQGVQPRQAVLVYLPNCVEWQVALLACLQLHAIPATLPINTDPQTLAYICEHVGARAVIAAAAHRGRATGEFASLAAASSPYAVAVAVFDPAGAMEWTAQTTGDDAPIHPAYLEHLMFTSSTTGLPKAVMHTIDTLAAVNITFAERYALSADTAIFMPSPLGHSVGAWHGGRLSLFLGAHLVLQDHWDPEAALAAIDRHSCQFTAAATPFLKDLLDAPWRAGSSKMSSLTAFLCGGAPVPASLIEEAARQAPDTFVTVLWGMTEGGVTTCPPVTPAETVAHSAGYPLPGLQSPFFLRRGSRVTWAKLAMRGTGSLHRLPGSRRDVSRTAYGGWLLSHGRSGTSR